MRSLLIKVTSKPYPISHLHCLVATSRRPCLRRSLTWGELLSESGTCVRFISYSSQQTSMIWDICPEDPAENHAACGSSMEFSPWRRCWPCFFCAGSLCPLRPQAGDRGLRGTCLSRLVRKGPESPLPCGSPVLLVPNGWHPYPTRRTSRSQHVLFLSTLGLWVTAGRDAYPRKTILSGWGSRLFLPWTSYFFRR